MHFTPFILGFALLLVLSLTQSAQAGGFLRTCPPPLDIAEDGTLIGQCEPGVGEDPVGTRLDLNKCIGVGGGALIYEPKYAGP